MTKYYAVHTKEYWDKISSNEYMTNIIDKEKFPEHYAWMKDEMKKRLSNYSGDSLLWWWKGNEPETDTFPWNGDEKVEMVLLEAELNEDEALDSNYFIWDFFCVSDRAIPNYDEFDDDDFYDRTRNLSLKDVQYTWSKVFNLEWCRKHPILQDYEYDDEEVQNIQSTSGEIATNRIKVVKTFTPITYKEWLEVD